MIATLKIQLKPTKEQEEKFKHFTGIARFTYNNILNYCIYKYELNGEHPSLQECIEEVQRLKRGVGTDRDYSWLNDAPEAVTKQAINDVKTAFSMFFKGITRFPTYKKKGICVESFYQRTDKIWANSTHVNITKVGAVAYSIKSRGNLEGITKFLNPRVVYDGKYWYLTFGFECNTIEHEEYSEAIGIDVGVKTLAVLSNGDVYNNVDKVNKNYNKEERKLKKSQRKFSRQYEALKKDGRSYKEAKNIRKTKQKIKLQHRKLANMRETHLHTVTAEIVKAKPSRVVIEILNIKGMLKNRHLARALAKQSLNKFKTFLTYKCEYNGIELVTADRFFPSSKLCSCCGFKRDKLSLSERVYTCNNCGNSIDRDLNAAINLSRL